jgi:hypothetical protein
LQIPFVVVHDLDIYEGDSLADWQKRENERAPVINALISEAAGADVVIHQIAPNLESALRVGRGASDKPRLVLAATKERTVETLPQQLVAAVQGLIGLIPGV